MFFNKKKIIKKVMGGPVKSGSLTDIFENYGEIRTELRMDERLKYDSLINLYNPTRRNEFIKKLFGDGEIYAIFKSHSNNSDFRSILISCYIHEKSLSFCINPHSEHKKMENLFVTLPEMITNMSEHQIVELLVEPLLSESSSFRDILKFLNYHVVDLEC